MTTYIELTSARTFLLQEAESRGWTTVEGIEVLICQAIEQQLIWTGKPQKEMRVEEVAEIIRNQDAASIFSKARL